MNCRSGSHTLLYFFENVVLVFLTTLNHIKNIYLELKRRFKFEQHQFLVKYRC